MTWSTLALTLSITPDMIAELCVVEVYGDMEDSVKS